MAELTVTHSYSEALFGAAEKSGALDDIAGQAREFLDVIKGQQKLRTFYFAPNIPRETKEEVFNKVFGDKLHKLLGNFVRLLIRRGRLELLVGALDDFQIRYERHRGNWPARVVTAADVSDEWKEKLQGALEKFTNLKLQINWYVDENVLGGVRFQVGDTLIDGTLSNGLERLRHDFERTRVF